MMFEEAGDDSGLRQAYLQSRIDGRRREGEDQLRKARALLAGGPARQGKQRAERDARAGLFALARSLDWAEDGPDEDASHRRLDEAGRWVRESFGCSLHREGTSYSQDCPVALAHNRIGFSVGGIATRVCALCGQDLSECEHQRGKAYLVPGGTEPLGWCRVCGCECGCDHSPDRTYQAGVVARITRLDLKEVSLVSKPAQPEARLSSVSVSHAELREELGDGFVPGMRVSCGRCLLPCEGLVKHDIPHG